MSSASLWETLPPRPPTPPRDTSKDVESALHFLQHGHDETSTLNLTTTAGFSVSASAPDNSSPTSNTKVSVNGKRVDFTNDPLCHEIPPHDESRSPSSRLSRQSSLSVRQAKPLKSILKATHGSVPPTPEELDTRLSYFSPQEPGSFRKMLQSVLNQLAAQSRSARLDAYQAIIGTLRAYDGVPDTEAIVEKIDLLCQFLARDIAWKDDNGVLDQGIVNSALRLTAAIIFDARISTALDDDFRCFVLDRSISIIGQDGVPKMIFKSHMVLLCQPFQASIMTPLRAEKLLTALTAVSDRCTGNSVLSARLMVYKRLLQQTRQMMLTRMRDWIEHVVHGLLSSVGDNRARAIETWTSAALVLGGQSSARRIVYDMFEKDADDGQNYGDYFNDRLRQMSEDKQTAIFVPQIWSGLALFWRSKSLNKWPRSKGWFKTLQRCLNSGDIAVKQAANKAWDVFVFCVMPDLSTPETLHSWLKIPIEKGLERKGHDKVSQQLRQIALDSYCNLLHYALRPVLSHDALDVAWAIYVSPVLTKMLTNGQEGSRQAQNIICGLLIKKTGTWNSNAANESQSIKTDELPRLDPRWVRSRLSKFIVLIEPMLQHSILNSTENRSSEVWRLLLDSVAEAGIQEIKTSNDLKQGMAHVMHLLRRLWCSIIERLSTSDDDAWLVRFQHYVEVAIVALGAGHFTETILLKSSTDDIEPALSPSHRTSKHSAILYSPFDILFALYGQSSPALQSTNGYAKSVAWLVSLLCQNEGSLADRVTLLHRSMRTCLVSQMHDDSKKVVYHVWNAVADGALAAFKENISASPPHTPHSLGNTLRTGVDILIDGLRTSGSENPCLERALELCSTMCRLAQHCAAEGGVVLGVLEPLSKRIVAHEVPMLILDALALGRSMLECATWPTSRQSTERSRKLLWATDLELPKSTLFNPYTHLYTMLSKIMNQAFEDATTFHACNATAIVLYLNAFSSLLYRCPDTLVGTCLAHLQTAIVPWVKDHNGHIFRQSNEPVRLPSASNVPDIPNAVTRLWTTVVDLIAKNALKKDSMLLQSLEALVSAGFASRSRGIVNTTIISWNATYGLAIDLHYPPGLQSILRVRREQAEILLPGFPESNGEEDLADLPAFAESQSPAHANVETVQTISTSGLSTTPTRLAPRETPSIVQPTGSNRSSRSGRVSTPRSLSRNSVSKVRLRHDDSQVDFASIEPSRPAEESDSQLLTDRQKDIRARQQEELLMYPDMSSSPAQVNDAKRGVPRMLNFRTKLVQAEEMDPLDSLADHTENHPMSDDLPSSPTPRTSSSVPPRSSILNEADDGESLECDPPSSPPRRQDDVDFRPGLHESTSTAQAVMAPSVNEPDVVADEKYREYEDLPNDVQNVPAQTESEVDLSSDTHLPAEQLQREQEAANANLSTGLLTEPAKSEQDDVRAKKHEDSSYRRRPISRHTASGSSYVGESFVRTSLNDAVLASDDQEPSPTPHSSNKKRKRSSESMLEAKKQKRTSNLKKFLSNILRGSQDNEDDMGDEIIVASRSTSFLHTQSQPDPELEGFEQSESHVVPVVAPAKRRPGRPRKSGRSMMKLHRGSSFASASSIGSSMAGETASAIKARKQRKSQAADRARDSQLEVDGADMHARLETRQSPLVLVPRSHSTMTPDHIIETVDDTDVDGQDDLENGIDEDISGAATPDHQLARELAAALRGSNTVQPRSDLSRVVLDSLQMILPYCKNMILGSQEEREFDDTLFEMRKAGHAAAQRSKE